MSEQGKAQVSMVGAGLVGFALVVGAGGLLFMLPRGGAPIKTAAFPAAPAALTAPAPAGKTAAGAPMGESASVASSPAPLLVDSARESAPDAAPAPAAAPGAAPSAAGLVVTQHLDGSSSARSSARASVASAAPAEKGGVAAKKPFVAPKLDLSRSQNALVSSVHYGVSSRAELMGRAAGPVYNFSGKNPGSDQSGKLAAGAMKQVDAVQAKIDSSSLSDSDKAAFDERLGQAKQAAAATPAQ